MRGKKGTLIATALLVVAVAFITQGFGCPRCLLPSALAEAADLPRLDVNRKTDAIAEDLRKFFPEGTPKKYVEDALLGSGARIRPPDKLQRPNVVQYVFNPVGPMNSARAVTVMYYANDTVRQISATGTTAVFPRKPPADRSDAAVFDFRDYDDNVDDLVETFRIIFPKGTPRERVEEILVKWTWAQNWTRPDEAQQAIYTYQYDTHLSEGGQSIRVPHIWTIKAHYKKDDTLSRLLIASSVATEAFQFVSPTQRDPKEVIDENRARYWKATHPESAIPKE